MTQQFTVRHLTRADGRAVGLLTEEVFHEMGAEPMHSAEATELMFDTPWLANGDGLVLECQGEMAGFGWARDSVWNGKKFINVGLYLRKPFRDRKHHELLTKPLLELAIAVARKYGTHEAVVFCRSIDTFHPPILRDMGFREHPVSMLGFRHDLESIPFFPLPPDVTVRTLSWPGEKGLFTSLSQQVFDDRPKQGEPLHPDTLDFEMTKPSFHSEQFNVVEQGGRPVGYLIILASWEQEQLLYEIAELGILPECRGTGLGKALMCYGLNWVKRHGGPNALTAAFSTNPVAALYWRLGFRPDPARTFIFFTRHLLPA
ncbi:MAG: GNAT family N-acetyltransferase [candidate division WOR-3 bacterium]